jgi:predicted secreted protein with PEFG-CTERM motif
LKPENNVAPILVVVTNPIGNVVSVEQISPAPNGDFSLSLNTKSQLWKQDGTYIVKIQSGSDSRQFKTKFILDSSIGNTSKCTSKEITITASNGEVYCLPFKFSNGTIPSTSGTLDIGSKTLSLKITGTVANSIILDIPRSILDSKSQSGSDSEFIVMSDGKIISFQQLGSDADSRQVKIEYSPAHSGNYQITGTHVIPEFGTIASLVLVGSIVSVLFLSGSFSNRFVKF